MVSARAIFRFIYGSFYFVLCTLLVCLLLVTPGDTIYQAYENNQWYNIWFVAAALVGILIIVSFIYALRLYNNKTILASIPKSWVPIEKGDVPKRVFEMVTAALDRSAIIQFESRPRIIPKVMDDSQSAVSNLSEKREECTKQELQLLKLRKREEVEETLGMSVAPRLPVWGEIEHRGWSSPESPDLPDLQYSTVLSELPNLIEAKALTLAPPIPESTAEPPMLDPDAMALLERPYNLGLRQYLNHLSELGVLSMDATTVEFLTLYEYARFSNRPLTNSQFRDTMQLFAQLLRSMRLFDPSILDPEQEPDENARAASESDIGNDDPPITNPSTPRSTSSRTTSSSRLRVNLPPRNSSAVTWHQYRTAPSTLQARSTGALSHASSMSSLAQRRQVHHSPSNASLRSKVSQSSGASVIRLAGRADATDLPYVLTMVDSR
ncbi:hypothetical protein BN1723_006148, partial [Verticillium longisporum]